MSMVSAVPEFTISDVVRPFWEPIVTSQLPAAILIAASALQMTSIVTCQPPAVAAEPKAVHSPNEG
jgi:hypothetical protein